MKNIILQHFDGELRELDKKSIDNIRQYADRIGAEYKLIRGKPFNDSLTSPCQKVHMINEEWDQYSNVLLLDIDMFAPFGMNINIFEQTGVGTALKLLQPLITRAALPRDRSSSYVT